VVASFAADRYGVRSGNSGSMHRLYMAQKNAKRRTCGWLRSRGIAAGGAQHVERLPVWWCDRDEQSLFLWSFRFTAYGYNDFGIIVL